MKRKKRNIGEKKGDLKERSKGYEGRDEERNEGRDEGRDEGRGEGREGEAVVVYLSGRSGVSGYVVTLPISSVVPPSPSPPLPFPFPSPLPSTSTTLISPSLLFSSLTLSSAFSPLLSSVSPTVFVSVLRLFSFDLFFYLTFFYLLFFSFFFSSISICHVYVMYSSVNTLQIL